MLNKTQAGTLTRKKAYIYAAVGFLITLCMCLVLVFFMADNRVRAEQMVVEQLIAEQSVRLNDRISHLLFRIMTIETSVQFHGGNIRSLHFQRLAEMLADDPAIRSLILAPNAVVTDVFPREGNYGLVGTVFITEAPHDYYVHSERDQIAMLAKETREIVIGGPFPARYGGYILIGRKAVFLEDENGIEEFWGMIGIRLDLDMTLRDVGFEVLSAVGYDYKLWRIDPDTGAPAVIARFGYANGQDRTYIERPIYLMNTQWHLRIYTPWAWHTFAEIRIAMLLSLSISLLVALLLYNDVSLRRMKAQLEELSHTDALTGIRNRRFFMEAIPAHIARIIRHNAEAFILMMDLDEFKKTNDIHGHQVGDEVLKEVARRITATVRGYDLAARYGGEEFIVFVSEIDKQGVIRLAHRIKDAIAEPIQIGALSLTITVSIGIAEVATANTLEASINFADRVLYKAKNTGRNKVVFCEQCAECGVCPKE